MFKKLLFASSFALAPMLLSENALADHCRGYGGYGAYRAPVVRSYSVPAYGYRHGHHHRGYSSGYRGYGGYYGSPYRSYYGSRFGYGYPGYYGRGTSIGIGRGGVSLNFGF